MDEYEFLTTAEAAEVLRLSPKTLERFRVEGTGPRYHEAGPGKRARVLYRQSDLVERVSSFIRSSTSTIRKLDAVSYAASRAARWHSPSFFKCQPAPREEVPHAGRTGGNAPLGRQSLGDFVQRDVLALFDQFENERFMRVKLRASRLALTPRRQPARLRQRQLIAVEAPTEKSAAAPRADIPASIASTTRRRRSNP